MQLDWSHAVLYVRDEAAMLDFYTRVLGFREVDRGPLGPDAPEIIFLSQSIEEHHQLAMLPVRKDDERSNSVNHFAFRTGEFADLQALNATLENIDGVKIAPLSHGNTLSLYFNDPENNGLEVFWDTPWQVAQPQGKPWDVALSEAEALDWVQQNFQDEPEFALRADYEAKRQAAFSS